MAVIKIKLIIMSELRKSEDSISKDGEVQSTNSMKMTHHEWQDQEPFVKFLEKRDLDNPHVYKKLNYYNHDWDNIPPVVPRFIIHLSKYTETLVNNMRY